MKLEVSYYPIAFYGRRFFFSHNNIIHSSATLFSIRVFRQRSDFVLNVKPIFKKDILVC